MGSLQITFSAHKFHTFWTNYLFAKYIRLKRFHQFCIFSFFFTFLFHFSVFCSIFQYLSKENIEPQSQEAGVTPSGTRIIFDHFFTVFFANFLFLGGIFQSQRVGVSPPGTRMRDKDGDKKLA